MGQGRKRPLFGLLIGQLEESYISLIWPGVTDFVEENNIDLIIFTAKSPFAYNGFDFQHNTVNDYINKDNLDGVIVITSEMVDYLSKEEILDILKSFKDIPIISVGYPLDEYVSVLVDNRPGINAAMEHLIKKHNKRHIGFIKGIDGVPDSEERFNAYINSLEKYGIPFREDLVYHGDFSFESGMDGAKYFIDEYKGELDSVLCSDDIMALGLMKVLKDREYRVPEDLSVIGFDDIEKGRYQATPLSTIRQPLYEMGRKAAEVLSFIINGEKVPKSILLPTSLICRQSCGCLPIPEKAFLGTSDFKPSKPIEFYLDDQLKDLLIEKFNDDLLNIDKKINKQIPFLVNALFNDFKLQQDRGFLNLLNNLINYIYDSKLDYKIFQKALFNMLKRFSLYIINCDDRARFDHFTEAAGILISELIERKYSLDRMEVERIEWQTTDVVSGFNDSIDIDLLIENLIEDIPRLDIDTFYISLYEGNSVHIVDNDWKIPTYSNLFIGLENGEDLIDKTKTVKYRTLDILPKDYLSSDERRTLIFMPLYFRAEQFGLLLFKFKKSEVVIYENLRTQISNSLKISLLFKERQDAENELKTAFKKIEHANIQLRNISIKDELTGLYNRRGFIKLGKKEYEEVNIKGGSFVLFFLDLDRLKYINDTYGHDAGDSALKDFSEVLKKVFRDKDIIARLAGDEFTVVAINAGKGNIESILSRLDLIISRFNETSNSPYTISASSGYAVYSKGMDSSFEELIASADENLYIEKKRKKGIE